MKVVHLYAQPMMVISGGDCCIISAPFLESNHAETLKRVPEDSHVLNHRLLTR